jgi:hypothetical protein
VSETGSPPQQLLVLCVSEVTYVWQAARRQVSDSGK